MKTINSAIVIVFALLASSLGVTTAHGQNYPSVDSRSGSNTQHIFRGQWDTNGDGVVDANHELLFTTESSTNSHVNFLEYESIQSQIQAIGYNDPPFTNSNLNALGGHSGIRGLTVTSFHVPGAGLDEAIFGVDWTFDRAVPAQTKIILWDPGEGSNLPGSSTYQFQATLSDEVVEAENWDVTFEDPYPDFDAFGSYEPSWDPETATITAGRALFLQQFPEQIAVITVDEPFDRLQLTINSTANEWFGLSLFGTGFESGDFNGDGVLDVADLDALTAEVWAGTNDTQFDLDGNRIVNTDDQAIWISNIKNTFYGDANLDGQVNAEDLNRLALNWLSMDASSWLQGDFNGDGNVNPLDLNDLALNWRSGAVAAASAHTVPEPSSAALLLLGSLAFVRNARRRVG